jgi:hypothetical protein
MDAVRGTKSQHRLSSSNHLSSLEIQKTSFIMTNRRLWDGGQPQPAAAAIPRETATVSRSLPEAAVLQARVIPKLLQDTHPFRLAKFTFIPGLGMVVHP